MSTLASLRAKAEEVALPAKKRGRSATGTARAKARIFPTYKQKSLDALGQSIEMAKAYFEDEMRVGIKNRKTGKVDVDKVVITVQEEIKDETGKITQKKQTKTYTQYFPAPNWTITNRKKFEEYIQADDEKQSEMEKKNGGKPIVPEVAVSLKVGKSSSLPMFEKKNERTKQMETLGYTMTEGNNVVNTLETFKLAVADMESGDGDLGTMFHEHAIKIAKPNTKVDEFEYSEEKDCYERITPVA